MTDDNVICFNDDDHYFMAQLERDLQLEETNFSPHE